MKCPHISIGRYAFFHIETALESVLTRAVVCRLFRKPVNLLQKTVGYRLTFIQSSDL